LELRQYRVTGQPANAAEATVEESTAVKPPSRIRVLIVDDHPIVRVGIAAIIEATRDMTVVAQAGSGEEAVDLYAKHLPDITLMDLRLPRMTGVETIRTVMARHRNARFVVLTTYEGDEDIHQALEAGARSYLIKGMPHDALVNAIRRVHAGGRFLPPPITRTLSNRLPESSLSSREREVQQGNRCRTGHRRVDGQVPCERDPDAIECQRPHPGGCHCSATRLDSSLTRSSRCPKSISASGFLVFLNLLFLC
jgi:DNA-binding NarL/FixJ family response regulator